MPKNEASVSLCSIVLASVQVSENTTKALSMFQRPGTKNYYPLNASNLFYPEQLLNPSLISQDHPLPKNAS